MKRPKKRYLTTEELADELIRCIEKSTPDEKAKHRMALNRAFGDGPDEPADDQPVTLQQGLEIFRRELEKRSRKTKVWIN